MKERGITVKASRTVTEKKEAADTSNFKFPCNIIDGTCDINRERGKTGCHCCKPDSGSCADLYWFTHEGVIPLDRLDVYAEKYDEVNGYWTPKGCALDRQDRPLKCISYVCITNIKDFEAANTEEDIALRNKMLEVVE